MAWSRPHQRLPQLMRLRRGFSSPGMIGLAVLLVLLTMWTTVPGARVALRERTFDQLLPLLPQPPGAGSGLVIVDIDRAALAKFGPWPWPRTQLAGLVDAVASAKPAVVGLDMLLAGPDRFASDGNAILAQSLAHAPTVLGFVLDPDSDAQDLPATPILASGPVSLTDVWHAQGAVGPSPQ